MSYTNAEIEMLRLRINGLIITPDDSGYDAARKAWNADIDRRPAIITQCGSVNDVVTAVRFAQEAGLQIAVRGGAHSFPGYSVCDGGLVIDLRQLNAVSVDPKSKTARVQGGALLSHLDAATQAHGLAVPAGVVSHTGVGGLTLGGGMGWLTRRAGLSIDNLVAAEVVLADGRVLKAHHDQNADLFWAIRGGGGNFGVVTEFTFRLHNVGPMVQFGLFFWGAGQGRAALRLMRDVIVNLHPSLNAMPVVALTAPPAPFVPPEHQHKTGYALMLAGFGDPAEHQKVTEHLRTAEPPLFDFVTTMPYMALQSLLDEPNGWGSYGYDKGAYFENLTDEMIDVLITHGPAKNSPLSLLIFYRLDEAYSQIAEQQTAFGGGRSPRYFGTFVAMCPNRELLAAEREWVGSLFNALKPHMLEAGTYINVLSEADDIRIRQTYGPKHRRLQAIKAKYDPHNVFRGNANIAPATATKSVGR